MVPISLSFLVTNFGVVDRLRLQVRFSPAGERLHGQWWSWRDGSGRPATGGAGGAVGGAIWSQGAGQRGVGSIVAWVGIELRTYSLMARSALMYG